MFDFSNLDVHKGHTATCYIPALQVEDLDVPYLIVRPATSATPAYFNELLKYSQQLGVVNGANLNSNAITNIRNRQRELFAEYIVLGWDNIFNSEVQKVEFSKSACGEFLQAIPDWIFADVVVFASDNKNFVKQIDALAVDKKAKK